MANVNNFVEREVPSGLKVQIRPRTYAEWEAQEEQRFSLLEALPDATEGVKAVEIAGAKMLKVLRNSVLELCVKDFDKLKEKLTLRDIAEIEKAVLALEGLDIPLGNSATGGDGQ